MNDLIGIHARLEHIYAMYVESAFPLRDDDLRRERRALLAKPGMLAQVPLLEPVTTYESSPYTLAEAARTLPGRLADLQWIAAPLLPPGVPLYQHQLQALMSAAVEGRGPGGHDRHRLGQDRGLLIAAAGGTGQGKCRMDTAQGACRGERMVAAERRAARGAVGASDPPRSGARALLLYPLNALVEDQLKRLRSVLTAPAVTAWLDRERDGNRVTFGRYTGLTPIAGPADGIRGKRNAKRLRAHLNALDEQWKAVERAPDPELRDHFPDPSSGEMWSRWDMQASPPDLLITNYSMLNIMLMREVERPIFEETRAWLASDPSHVFHLIVDELHSYRGTPGTEVSYIVRLLLSRLGLTPDSPQLRIIATSASLNDDEPGRRFLTEFFGRPPERFEFVSGQERRMDVSPAQQGELTSHASAFEAFVRAVQPDPVVPPAPLPLSDGALHQLIGALGGEPHAVPAHQLAKILERLHAPALLREACRDESGQIRATRTDVLTARLLPGRPDALRGLLMAIAAAQHPDGRPVLALRGHLFFQNVQNLWACLNVTCMPNRVGSAPKIGRLHDDHRLACDCGSRVLDVIVCDICGEGFYGAQRKPQGRGSEYLSADRTDLENVPEGEGRRTHGTYAVLWPVTTHAAEPPGKETYSWTPQESGTRLDCSWQKAFLQQQTGILSRSPKRGTGRRHAASVGVYRQCREPGSRARDAAALSSVRHRLPAAEAVSNPAAATPNWVPESDAGARQLADARGRCSEPQAGGVQRQSARRRSIGRGDGTRSLPRPGARDSAQGAS